jgi:hypothetical protein
MASFASMFELVSAQLSASSTWRFAQTAKTDAIAVAVAASSRTRTSQRRPVGREGGWLVGGDPEAELSADIGISRVGGAVQDGP